MKLWYTRAIVCICVATVGCAPPSQDTSVEPHLSSKPRVSTAADTDVDSMDSLYEDSTGRSILAALQEDAKKQIEADIVKHEQRFPHDAFQYVQWQGTLFTILLTVLTVFAGVAYSVGLYLNRQSMRRTLKEEISPVLVQYKEEMETITKVGETSVDALYYCAVLFLKIASSRIDKKMMPKAEFERAQRDILVYGARLQVLCGHDGDVYAGVTKLREKGNGYEDSPILRLVLQRPDLSPATRLAIKDAVELLEGGGDKAR